MAGQQGLKRELRSSVSRRRLLGGLAVGSGAATLLAACGKSGQARGRAASTSNTGKAPQRGGTFTYYWNANPPALDPQFFATGSTTSWACAVMSGLFRFKIGTDPKVGLNHELENELATSAEAPDGITWTFKLRPDAAFHNVPPVNGHPVEADDVKATFVRGVTSSQNANRSVISMVDPAQIQTPDPHTVVFKLKYPYGPFANLLGSVQYGLIFPREVQGGYDPAKQIIGSGPFVFDSYTPDVGVTLKRNPSFFEQGLPYLDGIRHAIIPNTAQQVAQFASGNLYLLHVQQNDLDAATKSAPNALVIKAAGGGLHPVYFQLGEPNSPFQDIRLRQAASMAIDRDTMGKALFGGQYDFQYSVLLSMGDWALNSGQLDQNVQQYYKFNLPAAQKLVEQAGATNLTLKLAYPAHAFDTTFDSQAQTVYNMLQALPWKLTALVPLDYNKEFNGAGKGYTYGFYPADTMLLGGINPFPETDQYLYSQWFSTADHNTEHVKDQALDDMLVKARSTINTDARRLAYLDVQKYIAGKVYDVSGLPAGYNYTLVRPEVQNYGYSPETNSDGRSFRTLWLQR